MSNYIYNPPPPPPPPPSSTISENSVNRGGYNANYPQPGNRGNRDGRGGGPRHGGFNRGGNSGGGRWRDPNSQQFPQQHRQPHLLPQFPPTTHYNPAFIAQQQNQQYQQYQLPQQAYSNQYFNNDPNYTNHHYQSPPPAPPPQQQLHNPYFSYSQEHYQSQNPQSLPLKPPQQQQHLPNPPTVDWPTHSSYGHLNAPSKSPPRKQQKRERDGKPDMDEATWLSLNGGKLIGTNIAPPETPEEIEAWIAQRKSRFPTAKKIEEDIAKKQEIAARAEEEAKRVAAQREKERNSRTHTAGSKRKRDAVDSGERDSTSILLVGSDIDNDYDTNASDSDSEDNAPPETTSSKVKTAVPEVAHQKSEGQGPKKSTARCRDFLRGKCPKGDRCRFRHEKKEPVQKGRARIDEKKTLYQRLVEHDREKENNLMLQVIQYLIDKGHLSEETPQKDGEI